MARASGTPLSTMPVTANQVRAPSTTEAMPTGMTGGIRTHAALPGPWTCGTVPEIVI
jgi:hypothetical protein